MKHRGGITSVDDPSLFEEIDDPGVGIFLPKNQLTPREKELVEAYRSEFPGIPDRRLPPDGDKHDVAASK